MEIEAQIADPSSPPRCVGLGEVRIEVDTPNCIGCGGCTAFATRTFIINDDLVAELTGELDDLDDLLSAAQSCPLYAITLFDGDGARLYPPD